MDNIIATLAQITIDPMVPTEPPTQGTITILMRLFFGIMAAVAVLVIVIASILFALSRGNPDKAARARNAIIYSAIGLAIAMGAQAIIQFVIGNV